MDRMRRARDQTNETGGTMEGRSNEFRDGVCFGSYVVCAIAATISVRADIAQRGWSSCAVSKARVTQRGTRGTHCTRTMQDRVRCGSGEVRRSQNALDMKSAVAVFGWAWLHAWVRGGVAGESETESESERVCECV